MVDGGLTHHQVPRPWGDQHVVVAGDGPPVLLVHGWPQHWQAWRRVIEALAPHRRVIAVDLCGFGWSDGLRRPRGDVVGGHVADLVAVLDHFELDRVDLAGHDWGGWIGFRAVERHPDRFSSYLALGITPPWLDRRSLRRHLPDWSYVFPMALLGHRVARSPRIVRWMVEVSSADRERWTEPGEREALDSYVERIARPEAAAMTRALYRAYVCRELPAAVGGRTSWLTVPTTVMVGEHETIARPSNWWRRARAGEVELVVVPGVDHWLAEEATDAVVDYLMGNRVP